MNYPLRLELHQSNCSRIIFQDQGYISLFHLAQDPPKQEYTSLFHLALGIILQDQGFIGLFHLAQDPPRPGVHPVLQLINH